MSSDCEKYSETPVPARAAAYCGRAVVVVGAFIAALALGEVLVRVSRPHPPVQIVTHRHGLEEIGGIPMWKQPGSEERIDADCFSRGPRPAGVVLVGSSIFFGAGLAADQSLGTRLQERLDRAYGQNAPCVSNLAQNGFRFDQKYAVAREFLRSHRPRLLFWEIWASDVEGYVKLGRRAYALGGIHVGRDGYPSAFGLPSPFNRVLFEKSRLYEYATLVLASRERPGDVRPLWKRFAERKLPLAVDLARQSGSQLVFVLCPPLSAPFSESARKPFPGYKSVVAFARAHGVPVISLADELSGRDYLRLRQDSCCHYNAEGQKILAEVLFHRARDILHFPSPP